jgi:hypothetical protein
MPEGLQPFDKGDSRFGLTPEEEELAEWFRGRLSFKGPAAREYAVDLYSYLHLVRTQQCPRPLLYSQVDGGSGSNGGSGGGGGGSGSGGRQGPDLLSELERSVAAIEQCHHPVLDTLPPVDIQRLMLELGREGLTHRLKLRPVKYIPEPTPSATAQPDTATAQPDTNANALSLSFDADLLPLYEEGDANDGMEVRWEPVESMPPAHAAKVIVELTRMITLATAVVTKKARQEARTRERNKQQGVRATEAWELARPTPLHARAGKVRFDADPREREFLVDDPKKIVREEDRTTYIGPEHRTYTGPDHRTRGLNVGGARFPLTKGERELVDFCYEQEMGIKKDVAMEYARAVGWKYGPKLGERSVVDILAEEGKEGLVALGVVEDHASMMFEAAEEVAKKWTKAETRAKKQEQTKQERRELEMKAKAQRRYEDDKRRLASAAARGGPARV